MERFIVGAANGGFEFTGLILQAHEDVPCVVRYRIELDESWRTREVEIELEDGGQRSLSLSSDGGGHWTRDGRPLKQPREPLGVTCLAKE